MLNIQAKAKYILQQHVFSPTRRNLATTLNALPGRTQGIENKQHPRTVFSRTTGKMVKH
jgi:hypothetical protein